MDLYKKLQEEGGGERCGLIDAPHPDNLHIRTHHINTPPPDTSYLSAPDTFSRTFQLLWVQVNTAAVKPRAVSTVDRFV